jgi:hypothetical protein
MVRSKDLERHLDCFLQSLAVLLGQIHFSVLVHGVQSHPQPDGVSEPAAATREPALHVLRASQRASE